MHWHEAHVLTIRPIKVVEHLDSAQALMREHWIEVEGGISEGGPKPDAQMYDAMEQSGATIAFGAFEGDSVLVGYVVVFIGPHMHYGFTFAQHDVLFVKRTYRSSGLGLRLIRAAENEAKARGAKCIVWHAKANSDFDRVLARRTGCVVEDILYRKDF